MKKYYPRVTILIIFLILLIAAIVFYKQTQDPLLCTQQSCRELELANTDAERAQGLMYREELADDTGMLFIFDQAKETSFWMQNTLIPLDIVWIDENLEILGVSQAEPCVAMTGTQCELYPSPSAIKYVLEVNKGSFDGKVGERISLSH